MDNTVQRIIDLVHRRDELCAERAKVTESLDREIALIESQLALLGTRAAPQAGPAQAAALAAMPPAAEIKVKAGTQAAKLISIVAQNPAATFDYLVRAIYGSDNETTRHNLRSVMWNLKKTDRLPRELLGQEGAEDSEAA